MKGIISNGKEGNEKKNEKTEKTEGEKDGNETKLARSKRPKKEEKFNIRDVVTPLEQNTLQLRGYRLSYKLGEGSYANVYRTDYSTTINGNPVNQVLACKIIDAAKAPKDFVNKFLPRELDILNKINHPHLIHVHSIFQCKKKFFIFMRYAEEGDLLDYVLRKDVGESQARVWFRQLAVAVEYLHTLDIVHRDIKCENVLLTRNMNVKLADFGFSRSMNSKTFSCTYCGSLAYASPEILRGLPYCPKAADVWSLGVLLFVILNQSMPFSDANVKKLYQQQMLGHWSFRSKIAKVVSDQVKDLVASMLRANGAERYTIHQVVDSEWIKMNAKLAFLNDQEKEALQKALAYRHNTKKIKTEQPKVYQPQSKKKCAPILVVTPSKIGISSKCYRYSEIAHVSPEKSAIIIQNKSGNIAQDKSANTAQDRVVNGALEKSFNGIQDKTLTGAQNKSLNVLKISQAGAFSVNCILPPTNQRKPAQTLQTTTTIVNNQSQPNDVAEQTNEASKPGLLDQKAKLTANRFIFPDPQANTPSQEPDLPEKEANDAPQTGAKEQSASNLITPFSRLSLLGKVMDMSLQDVSLSQTLQRSNIFGSLRHDSKGPSLTEIKAIDKSVDFKSNPTLNTIL